MHICVSASTVLVLKETGSSVVYDDPGKRKGLYGKASRVLCPLPSMCLIEKARISGSYDLCPYSV